MARRFVWLRSVALLGAVAIWSATPADAEAQGSMGGIGTIEVADPTRPADGTIHPAALAAQLHGPLPVGAAETAYQAMLGRAGSDVLLSVPRSARASHAAKRSPAIVKEVDGVDFYRFTPSGTTFANGPDTAIQAVNRIAALFGDDHEITQRARLTLLGGLHRSVVTQNPQVIWDAQTNRFYYAMSASAGAGENRVAFGFSKTATPNNLSSDLCHYTYNYASRFLDNLSLGDNKHFIIFSGNAFSGTSYVGSDINAVSKPPPGTTCPRARRFKTGFLWNIRDSGGVLVPSPVAANQIDDLDTGFVVARDSGVFGFSDLWQYNITKHPTTGNPVFTQNGRLIDVPDYGAPPVAEQPTKAGQPFTRLRTLDARLTNASMAYKPLYGRHTLYTQHTVGATGNRSTVRWYEIDPVLNPSVVRRTGTLDEIAASTDFFFNAAIAPDRQVDGATKRFGNNFHLIYNFSSSTKNPGIGVASSVNGGPLTSRTVQNGVAPYIDLSCPNNGDVCNWLGASAAPDPRPSADRPRQKRGVVWGTIQYSGDPDPRPEYTDWVTRIIGLQP